MAIFLKLVFVIVFLFREATSSFSLLLMLLFLPSKTEFSVEYKRCLLIADFSAVKLYLRSYSGLILSFMSVANVRIRNISEELLIDGGSNFFIGTEISSLASYFSVLALQGVFPVNIS